jgi:hypothetical protein
MATAIETRDGGAPAAVPTARIPEAVWINRPTPGSDRARRATRALAVAVLLGLAAVAAKYAATGPLLPSAVAGIATAAGSEDGPAGYFPAQFDRSRLAPAEQPPTF